MSQCSCTCQQITMLPISGFGLAVDSSALAGGQNQGIDYSTDEQWTGRRWIDGKKIYQKTIICGALPDTDYKDVPANISNFEAMVALFGVAYGQNPVARGMTLPHVAAVNATAMVQISYHDGGIRLRTASNFSTTFPKSYITIQYTCTDR